MRIVDHVLIVHRIWVAQDESRQLLVFLVSLQVVFVNLLGGRWEKHCIDLGVGAFVLDPDMLAVESVGENLAHLLRLTEKRSEAALTGCASTEAIARFGYPF